MSPEAQPGFSPGSHSPRTFPLENESLWEGVWGDAQPHLHCRAQLSRLGWPLVNGSLIREQLLDSNLEKQSWKLKNLTLLTPSAKPLAFMRHKIRFSDLIRFSCSPVENSTPKEFGRAPPKPALVKVFCQQESGNFCHKKLLKLCKCLQKRTQNRAQLIFTGSLQKNHEFLAEFW